MGGGFEEKALADLEELLISADVGVGATQKLLKGLQEDLKISTPQGTNDLKALLRKGMLGVLNRVSSERGVQGTPHVILVVGVNGAGKTTSIAKLAHHHQSQNKKVLLAAADTFRAGAVSQLKIWGDRVGATTLSQKDGTDPSAVAFDAVKAGVAREQDVVIIDTAGRLHTQSNLMEELKKIKRVVTKALPEAPHEVLLVIDGTQGQNALQQAKIFNQALGLTGLILTKLDGTPKGGIVLAVSDELQVRVQWIGVGEGLDDLRPFDAEEFVGAILD